MTIRRHDLLINTVTIRSHTTRPRDHSIGCGRHQILEPVAVFPPWSLLIPPTNVNLPVLWIGMSTVHCPAMDTHSVPQLPKFRLQIFLDCIANIGTRDHVLEDIRLSFGELEKAVEKAVEKAIEEAIEEAVEEDDEKEHDIEDGKVMEDILWISLS